MNSCYEACRSKRRELDGFPDFAPLVAELKGLSTGEVPEMTESFKVTASLPGGALVIRNQFFEQFNEMPEFEDLVQQHNKKFNPDGLTLAESTAPAPHVEERSSSKAPVMEREGPIKAETIASLAHSSDPQILIFFCHGLIAQAPSVTCVSFN